MRMERQKKIIIQKDKPLDESYSYVLTEKQKRYLPLKRTLDIVIAGGASIVLAPIMGILAVAIKLDSKGPVLFKQKRVGKDKEFFEIWKFRTMYVDTPKDMPTHLLSDPDAYITRSGRFMRKYSLDELPQLWQVVNATLTLVGPRPALWNQDDLIAERDKYGANRIKPGITGWAQVNGRDELEIPDKARFDGEYTQKMGLWMDIKCFFATIGSVLSSDGVVEGGTGEMHKEGADTSSIFSPEKIKKDICTGAAVMGTACVLGIGAISLIWKKLLNKQKNFADPKRDSHIVLKFTGAAAVVSFAATIYTNIKRRIALQDKFVEEDFPFCKESMPVVESGQKHILITGANSYIGNAVEAWLNQTPGKYMIETMDMLDDAWRNNDFSHYDVVFHVAGIAHADVGNVTEQQKQLYYKVNTELAVEVANKAKAAGVKQFIFMSSMIVYSGCKEKMIKADTKPQPLNFYGDSKWQADQRIRDLEDELFRVVVLRPPMIYGKGSKGNYPELVKLASKLPVFPIVKNKRSMLHIDNLCQFVKLMIDNQESGVFFPQNAEYTNTSDMVEMIAAVKGHRIVMLPFTNLPVKLMGRIPGKIGSLAEKAFGDLTYDMAMSEYKENYRVNSLGRSIELTEETAKGEGCHSNFTSGKGKKSMKVLIITNDDLGLYKFRKELLEYLVKEHEVHIMLPEGDYIEKLEALGTIFHPADVDRRGKNIFRDFVLFQKYLKTLRDIQPDVVLTYTVKPNIYGGFASRLLHIPYITNVTGLGTAIEANDAFSRVLLYMYRKAVKKASCIFFQNKENMEYFVKGGPKDKNIRLIPGSGVNLKEHCFEKYPSDQDNITFLFVGRLMRNKGVLELVEAAKRLHERYDNLSFQLVGYCEDDFKEELRQSQAQKYVELCGKQDDIHSYMKECYALVLPSYHEGMSNVLLEAAATGRPVLTTNVPGCQETFEEGISGLGCSPGSADELENVMERFIHLENSEKAKMGMAGRKKVEKEFDRNIIIRAYLEEINKIQNERK